MQVCWARYMCHELENVSVCTSCGRSLISRSSRLQINQLLMAEILHTAEKRGKKRMKRLKRGKGNGALEGQNGSAESQRETKRKVKRMWRNNANCSRNKWMDYKFPSSITYNTRIKTWFDMSCVGGKVIFRKQERRCTLCIFYLVQPFFSKTKRCIFFH